MAINFDSLPQENPFAYLNLRCIKQKLWKAEMKQGKDLSKPEYLNLKFSLTDKNESPAVIFMTSLQNLTVL